MFGRSRIVLVALVAALLFAAPASGNPTGAIATATTHADWSDGSFTGSAGFDASSCPDGPPCTWRADLTIQPNTRGCNALNWLPDGDPEVLAIWGSGDQASYGTVTFDLKDQPLLQGVIGQRACLYVAYSSPVVQGEQRTILGSVDMYHFTIVERLPAGGGGTDGAAAVEVAPVEFSPAPGTTNKAPPIAVLSRTTAVAKAKSALKRRYGRSYKRAKRKRLSCAKQSPQVYRCGFSFRDRKRKRSGTVTVSRTSAGIRVTVKAR
jgi:hypothetical protein